MPGKMSQSDFIAALKKELPELSDLSDNTIMSQVLKRKPELSAQIETPDDQAAVAQAKAEARSKSIVDPETWQKHPKIAEFSRQVLNAAPGVGSIVGGLALSPETFGAGSIPGMALGAGYGRGLRDIATSVLGLEKQKSPMEAASNIGMDAGLAAITPGIMEAIKTPVQTARELTGDLLKFSPRGLHRYTVPQILDEFAAGGKKPNIIPDVTNFKTGDPIPNDVTNTKMDLATMPPVKQGSRFTPNQFGMTADALTAGKNPTKLSSNPIVDIIKANPNITKQHLEDAIKMIMERDSSLTAPRSFRSPSFK